MSAATDCILAIETSTSTGSVAVVCGDGSTVYEQSFGSKRSHNSELFVPLREALRVAEGRLSLIVVGTGPGSYTGARIGIAAAQGLSLALGIPVVGMSSLVAPGVAPGEFPPGKFKVCGDARRGLYYVATVEDGRMVGEIEQLEAETFQVAYEEGRAERWYTFDDQVPLGLEGVVVTRPSAVALGRLVSGLAPERVKELATGTGLVEPVYLSAPFVTVAKGK